MADDPKNKKICPVLSETSLRKVPGTDRPVVGFRVVVCDDQGLIYVPESSSSDRPMGKCKWFDESLGTCQVSMSKMAGRLKRSTHDEE